MDDNITFKESSLILDNFTIYSITNKCSIFNDLSFVSNEYVKFDFRSILEDNTSFSDLRNRTNRTFNCRSTTKDCVFTFDGKLVIS